MTDDYQAAAATRGEADPVDDPILSSNAVEMTAAQHRDHFRGRCALALDQNASITRTLANAIRISPMIGCVDVGAIEACREHMAKMSDWLDQAEESARAVLAAEERCS